ncbi:MAG: hypothetical protein AAF493_17715 [Pseudomonadota bacterium]
MTKCLAGPSELPSARYLEDEPLYTALELVSQPKDDALMLGKILITALVIAVVVMVTRARGGGSDDNASPEPTASSADNSRLPIPMRTLAYIVAAALIGGALLFYWQHWRDWHEVVEVRVINTQSGEVAEYQVHKGSIQERSFKTVDGWKVTVSNIERLEMLNPN